MFKARIHRLRQIGTRSRQVGSRLGSEITRFGSRLKQSFHVHIGIVILILGFLVLLHLFKEFELLPFQPGNNAGSVLGDIVQSLSSIFAIVFSISLIAIQLFSENLSHRLIGLYVKNLNFLVPFALNLGALLLDLFLLSNERCMYFTIYGIHLMTYGILLSIFAVLSLILFFVFTVRFLRPAHVVRELLDQVEVDNLLLENYTERELYRQKFQPIEDIISSCARKGDYATAQDLIVLIREKMDNVVAVVERKMKDEVEGPFVRFLTFMSEPFAKLLEGIAVSSNKNDAIEITINVVNAIEDFVGNFGEARFRPAFTIFDAAIERILSQAKHRFSADEYAVDLARLEVAIARARVAFSQFVE